MRTVTPEALSAVFRALPARPRAVASGNFATPLALLDVLDREVPEFSLCMLNAQPGIPTREGVVLETSFVGPAMRGRANLAYVPSRLSLVPLLFATTLVPDVVLLHTSVPETGTVSLGTEVNILPAAVEAVRARGGVVVAQLNRRMPYTYGDGQLPLESIDYGLEVDEPLAVCPAVAPDDVASGIGERVASLVSDGSTLQLGIGSVPDATLQALSVRRGLQVWSEMFSDGVLALDRAGALDPDAVITSSFLFGSRELYEWVDHNRRVRVLRTEKTNDPGSIARQRGMTSVNSALQVDLFAQANASRIATRIYSGFGGQTDFIVGALHSPGGQALIALRSWHPKADCSTIVPLVDEPVTSFQHSAVVTEHGVAPIWGHTQQTQARHLIEQAAHPDVREELEEEAVALGLA
jgi:acyl-CoA hydrolase